MRLIQGNLRFTAFLLVIAVMVLGTALAGCGSSAAPAAAPTKAPASAAQPAAAQPAAAQPAAAAEQQLLEFKGGGTDPVNSPVDQMMQKYAKLLAERTNDKIKLTFFPAGQLGGERDIVEGVQLGTVGMAITGVTGHKIWDALWLPFLFRDNEHMWKVLRGPIGEEWGQTMLKDRGMEVTGYAYRLPRNITTTKTKITSAADLSGFKIRVPEIAGMVSGFKAMGANPTPMAWPEVITALQQGTIDGQENPYETLHSNKMWEVQKYLILTEHIRMPWTLLTDARIMEKVTPANRKIMVDTFREVADELEKNALAKNEEYLETFKKNGMTVVEQPELDIQSFRDATKDVWKEVTPAAWGEGVYERVQATK